MRKNINESIKCRTNVLLVGDAIEGKIMCPSVSMRLFALYFYQCRPGFRFGRVRKSHFS